MNTKTMWIILFALCFGVISVQADASSSQRAANTSSQNKKTVQPTNKEKATSKGYMSKAEFAAYVEKELAKISDLDVDMSAEDKTSLATKIYGSLGIASIKSKPAKLSKDKFISSELSKARESKEFAEKSKQIEKDAEKKFSVKKKGDPISVYTKTGKHYEGKFYGKTSSYITIDDSRIPLIDLSEDSLSQFSESEMSKKKANYIWQEKQRLLPDTYELNESYKKIESQALKNSFKDGYILSDGEWVSVKTIALSVINTKIQSRKKHIAQEAEEKRIAEEAEKNRIAKEAEQQKRIAETRGGRSSTSESGGERSSTERPTTTRPATGTREQREQRQAERKRLAEEAEQKRLAEEAEQKRLAEAPELERIAEEVAEEIHKTKSISLINNGPRQLITDDMNYEELDSIILQFANDAKKCKIANKLLPSYYDQNGYFLHRKEYTDIRNNKNISYKEKKQILMKYYSKVIKHIIDVYSDPIEQWEGQCLSETYYAYEMTHYCCCEWHATALAQRGCAKAQYQLGISVMYLKDREANKRVSLRSNVTVKEMFETDVNWLKLAGENGDSNAYYVLGKLFYDMKAYEAAVTWYKRGAEMNQTSCMYELGMIAKEVKETSTALSWFVKASELGHYKATLECANLYQVNSQNIRADYRKSINYYQKAIEMIKNEDVTLTTPWVHIEKYEEKIKELQLKIED